MAHRDRIPPTLAELPPELRRAVELGQPSMETVEKTSLPKCGYGFSVGENDQGGTFPILVWITPVGPGLQREIHIPFSPEAFDGYLVAATAFRDSFRTGAGPDAEPAEEPEAQVAVGGDGG